MGGDERYLPILVPIRKISPSELHFPCFNTLQIFLLWSSYHTAFSYLYASASVVSFIPISTALTTFHF